MRTQTDVIEPEWEVLPPEEKEKRARLEPLFRWVAIVMDELIAFPNTKFKFGLDPLIGLVPGIGDTASAIVSALVFNYCWRTLRHRNAHAHQTGSSSSSCSLCFL